MTSPSASFQCGPSGGRGGQQFVDSLPANGVTVQTVRVWHGQEIDAVQIVYSDGTMTPKHGGDGGSLTLFDLQPGERLVGISGRYGERVDSLVIGTNVRTFPPVGGTGGDHDYRYDVTEEGLQIVGFLGAAGQRVDAVGVIASFAATVPPETTIQASDYGAVGIAFCTTGDIAQGSTLLTIAGALLPSKVVPGSGLGITGALAPDMVTVPWADQPIVNPWFPAPTLRARVVAVDGNTVTLDRPADIGVVGAMVCIDDSLPIQAAADAAEKVATNEVPVTVRIGDGTFVWGSPFARDNAPMFIGSYVKVVGSGPDKTILKLCDHAAQISIGLMSNVTVIGEAFAAYYYPQVNLVTNAHNSFWHHQTPWLVTDAMNDPLVSPDLGGGLAACTLDGNWDNQVATVSGNRTDYVIPDQPAFNQLTLSQLPVPVQNGLKPGHNYAVVVTYADERQRECGQAANGPANIDIPDDGNAYEIILTHTTPPPGAADCIVYVIDNVADADGNYGDWGWYWGPDPNENLVQRTWVRTPLGRVPAPAETQSISSYVPAPGAANSAPPSSNYVQASKGLTAASNDSGVFLDNCTGFVLEDVKIQGFPLAGLLLTAADWNHLNVVPPHSVQDFTARQVAISRCGSEGVRMTGPGNNLTFDSVTIEHCPYSVNVESDVAPGPHDNMTFRACEFRGHGIIMVSFEQSPTRNLRFEYCLLDNCGVSFSGGGETQASFYECTIQNTNDYAVGSNGDNAKLFFYSTRFIHCGRYHPPVPDEYTGEQPRGAFFLAHSSWPAPVHYTHAAFVNCAFVQVDIPTGQVMGERCAGSILQMINCSFQTETQPAALNIETINSPGDYYLDDLTGTYTVNPVGNPALPDPCYGNA